MITRQPAETQRAHVMDSDAVARLESPLLSLSALGQSATHQLAADIAREGLPPGEKVTHVTKVNGTKVKVTLSPVDSPPKGTSDKTKCPTEPTREIERCAFEAAPKADAEPITVKALAKLAGYGYHQYFRNAVNALVESGLLVKLPGGVRQSKRATETR